MCHMVSVLITKNIEIVILSAILMVKMEGQHLNNQLLTHSSIQGWHKTKTKQKRKSFELPNNHFVEYCQKSLPYLTNC